VAAALALILGLAHLAGIALAVAGLGDALPGLRIRSLTRPAVLFLVSMAVVVALSARARALIRDAVAAPALMAAAGGFVACWLSLGPTPTTLGQPLDGLGLYGWLYRLVPGFDGLRAPARFAMIVALVLAVLAGLGVAELRRRGWRGWLVPAASVALLAESTAAPLVLNDVWRDYGLRSPPRRLLLGEETPPIYTEVETLPADAVLAELPFGSEPSELRYMLYTLEHGRRIVNGFSGAFPPRYLALRARLAEPLADPERAWTALAASGATHVIVHQGAWWRRGVGRKVSSWIEGHGGRRVAEVDDEVLFALP
jgi:hypothetical protein